MTGDKQTEPDLKRINPADLLRLMTLVACISIIIIITVASFGIYEVFQQHIIRGAEEDAVSLSELILAHEGKNLAGARHQDRLSIPAQNLGRLDRKFRSFLQPFNIIKIKIYDRDRRIIYSTDPSIIGRVDESNPRLENALAGQNDSKLETKETVTDLAEEQQIDVDVVESYVPIRFDQGEVLGCFEIYTDVSRYHGAINRGVLTSALLLTLILAVVFGASFLVVRKGTRQLHQAQDSLRHMATIDPLTGAFNRGEIMARARKETSRLRRCSERTASNTIALIMLDLDRFKNVNDKFGHLAGDLVLRQTTRRIKIELRDYDLFGRYGGEEFLAVLPATDLAAAITVAERMRRAVGDTPFDIEGKSLPVTISLGVSVIASDAIDLTGALKQADEALYQAKNSGRNRVCTAEIS
jgi:diguanylate cyclase (GGDEF)-like protein